MFYRDTWVEINLDRIYNNVNLIKSHAKLDHIFAVVKANAYGHGDIEVAKVALEAGADFLSVAFLDEALFIRRTIKNTPILVMGAIRPEDLMLAAENDIHVTAHDTHWVEAVKNYSGDPVYLHLKIDTGMNRIGFNSKLSINKACTIIDNNPALIKTGLFTHFATADTKKQDGYQAQLLRLQELISDLNLSDFSLVHLSNSASLLRFEQQSIANAGRLGISMYGLAPSDEFKLPFKLEQAFSLHSRIIQVKTLKKGDAVSYGGTFIADQDMRIGTIPIGYADGWLRYHQGRNVEINGDLYPIIGRICMDQCMIKIDDNINIGDKVNLINDIITVEDVARDLETIGYEIVCSISDRVPRIYFKNGIKIGTRNNRFD